MVQVVQLLGVVIFHEDAIVGSVVVDTVFIGETAHHIELVTQLFLTLNLELHLVGRVVEVDGDVACGKGHLVSAMVTAGLLGLGPIAVERDSYIVAVGRADAVGTVKGVPVICIAALSVCEYKGIGA